MAMPTLKDTGERKCNYLLGRSLGLDEVAQTFSSYQVGHGKLKNDICI